MNLREAIEEARKEYLKRCSTFPLQFNMQRCIDDEGNISWRAEFMPDEGTWNNCTTWESGDKASSVFFSNNYDELESEWDTEFDEKGE